ncbi:hypothetical protein Mapa_002922 [Marchantia paleacea]|nr:hypothetical protein Mapa_002922 [Marchantia paleacea]
MPLILINLEPVSHSTCKTSLSLLHLIRKNLRFTPLGSLTLQVAVLSVQDLEDSSTGKKHTTCPLDIHFSKLITVCWDLNIEKMSRAVVPTVLTGNPVEVYNLVTKDIPKAFTPGNVIVRMTLRPVNPTDSIVAQWGIWEGRDIDTITVGSEGTGVVHELAEGVTNFRKGQRVIPLIFNRYYPEGYGLWRDYVDIPAKDLIAVPDDIPDEFAAQFFVNPWALYQMLKVLNIPKGQYIIQAAAASVLGRQVITLAKHWGIKTINIVRRDSQIQELKDIGADYVLNAEKEDIVAKVNEITAGKKAYGALDPVLGEMSKSLIASVRNGGQVLAYGALSGSEIKLDCRDLMRGVDLNFFLVNDLGHDLDKREETSKEIFDLMRQKVIQPLSGKKFPLEQFKGAIIESNKPDRGGKVFLESYDH